MKLKASNLVYCPSDRDLVDIYKDLSNEDFLLFLGSDGGLIGDFKKELGRWRYRGFYLVENLSIAENLIKNNYNYLEYEKESGVQ